MNPPTIPARPSARSQELPAGLKQDTPLVPPRPHRRSDQSRSPSRDAFSRSPLNDLPGPMNSSSLHSHRRVPSDIELPPRPPSVNLPSIGQEGNEYAGVSTPPPDQEHGGPEHTRSVALDLPMHQPKAAVPQSTAKSRIQTVTRTDSSQAAAAGVGDAQDGEDKETEKQFLRPRASFNRSNVNLSISASPRPASVHEGEHEQGIPSIGVQVPMYPNAGDVQAPSPAPAQPHSAGIGFFNDGSQRNHHRRRSSRHEFGPPGSYGMHGHGVEPKDKFERAWYQRHPEEYQKELHHEYDPGHPRGQFALSSEDLNKLVHGSTNRGLGMASSPDNVGTPTEQIVYKASEDHSTRLVSPKPGPAPLASLRSRPSSSSHAHVESPLRKTSFPFNGSANNEAIDDDTDNETVQPDQPSHRASKVGGGGYDPPSEDLGPDEGNTEEEGAWTDERGHGMPILASDEVAKYPGGEYMLPAVDPEQEKRGDGYHSGYDSDHLPVFQHARKGSSHSRPSSRPGSQHGEPLSRLLSHDRYDASGVGTPLEEIQEYEPLFPDDDDTKPKTLADKVKQRPDALARHHFPSQDIWEDNPNSLDLTATVSTPQLPEEPNENDSKTSANPAKLFEHPDVEADRKEGDLPTHRADYYLPSRGTKESAKPHFKPGVVDEMKSRPGLAQRFPSQDIWEDSPDSLRLETTVGTPQIEEITSPPDASSRPDVPARPRQIPSVPARPSANKDTSPTERRGPMIPDRPKPQVPARSGSRPDQASTPLAREISPEITSPPEAKAKPAVPSRPAGSKLASIKASFMNDLNSRLQLGPQGPPPKKQDAAAEEAAEQEKPPLADARKGRARGPARRKPAAGPSDAANLSVSAPRVLFSLDGKGTLDVPSHEAKPPIAVAGEANETEVDDAPISADSNRVAAPADEHSLSGLSENAVGAEGDSPNPRLSQSTIDRQQAIQPMLSEALSDSAKTDKHDQEETQGVSGKSAGPMMDSSVQTGTQDISITSPTGAQEKLTTYLGGRAPEEGNVVVKAAGEDKPDDINIESNVEQAGTDVAS